MPTLLNLYSLENKQYFWTVAGPYV